MSSRTALTARAREHESTCRAMPHAREVLRPELLAGVSGVPLEWARRFHRRFFDEVDDSITKRCLLVLPDVVIARPDPLLQAVRRWGAAREPWDLTRLSTTDVARELTSVPGIERRIRTARDVFVPAFNSCPHLDDIELRCSMSAALCMGTTQLLRSLAPYVRVGDGLVVAYRPSSVFGELARSRGGGQEWS